MQNHTDTAGLLGINISFTVSPAVTFIKKEAVNGLSLQPGEGTDGGRFSLFADAALQFESVSRLLNGYLAGMRLQLSEGLFASHIVLKDVAVSGNAGGRLLLRVNFTGSFSGSLFVAGTPVYNEETKTIVLLTPRYDLQTNNFLLKGARLLFASRIEKELKKAANISISNYLELVQKTIEENLNREWTTGVRGSGVVTNLQLVSLQAAEQHLLIRAKTEGELQIRLSVEALSLQR